MSNEFFYARLFRKYYPLMTSSDVQRMDKKDKIKFEHCIRNIPADIHQREMFSDLADKIRDGGSFHTEELRTLCGILYNNRFNWFSW